MIGRKSVIGIAVMCALALSAFAAASASAEQRAYLCWTGAASRDYTDAHCTNKVAPQSNYGHTLLGTEVAIAATNGRTVEGTSASSPAKLKGALSGVETELQCTTVGGMGELSNAAASVSGTGELNYTGCSVTKPAGKGCLVKESKVNTEKLAATTVGQAANRLKFTPAKETTFAKITIEKCEVAALNNTFPVTGSLVATTSGATTSTTHAAITEQNTLKFGGVKAGLEGTITIGNGTPVVDGTAISLT